MIPKVQDRLPNDQIKNLVYSWFMQGTDSLFRFGDLYLSGID